MIECHLSFLVCIFNIVCFLHALIHKVCIPYLCVHFNELLFKWDLLFSCEYTKYYMEERDRQTSPALMFPDSRKITKICNGIFSSALKFLSLHPSRFLLHTLSSQSSSLSFRSLGLSVFFPIKVLAAELHTN